VSPRDWKLRVEDIVGAIAKILDYTKGMSFEQFAGNTLVLEAVMHNVMVLGEAARSLPPEVVATHPEIPFQRMREIRNVIVHIYFGIKTDILWEMIQKNLPPLVEPLTRLLNEPE
jgi:uncharacterized protein with HEPN domain